MLLISGRARNPTQALRDLLGDADDNVIRRLQRRWTRDGEMFLSALQGSWFEQRWQLEAEALKKSAPEVFARIVAFAESEGGSQLLSEHLRGRPTSSLMSLGISTISKLLVANAPTGAKAADHAFAQSIQTWKQFGAEPDAAFLKRFAQLCLQRAEALDEARGSDTTPLSNSGDVS